MKLYGIRTITILTLFVPSLASAQQAKKSRKWDQKVAVAKVKSLLKMETEGTPWNNIPWVRDPNKAVELAKQQNKPIFVYFYLKKNLGPVADPG